MLWGSRGEPAEADAGNAAAPSTAEGSSAVDNQFDAAQADGRDIVPLSAPGGGAYQIGSFFTQPVRIPLCPRRCCSCRMIRSRISSNDSTTEHLPPTTTTTSGKAAELQLPMWLVILLVLALFLFTLFWVVVPFVVQLIVTHSGINVVSLGLSSPTKNSVFLTSQMELVKPGVATMLSAEVKAFRMEMHLVPEEKLVLADSSSSDDITRIGDFGMPPISLHGGKTKEIVAVEQRFLISSEDNMVSLGASLLREKQLQIRVLGHSKVHVPNILLGLFGSYSVTFDKTLTIPGLDNLKGVIELTKFELPGEVFDPDDKKKVIAVEAEARINNPTNYTLELGHVLKLDCQFQNASMSRVELIDFVLTPGITENVTVKGVFAPTDFEKAADFLSEFVGGGGGNDIAEQKVWLHAKGMDVWFNRIGGSSWTGGGHGGSFAPKEVPPLLPGGDRAEDEEEPEHTFSAKDHNDDQNNQIRIPWFSRLVQSMASETGLNKVDGREFIRSVNISEIGFDVPGGEDNLHAWGLLDIDFKIPFAKFNYSITSLGAELDISQNNYTSSTASMKETEVGYIPNYADHSGILRIKMPLSPVALTNASAFNDLLFDVYSKPLVHIDLGGKGVAVMSSVLNPRWHLHDIPISVKTTIQGWNQFRDAAITVSHIDILKSQTTATQVHVGAVLELENKTPLSANLGFLPAHLIADNRVSLGTVKAYNAKLQAWSTARVEATVIVDRNSNGTWPHQLQLPGGLLHLQERNFGTEKMLAAPGPDEPDTDVAVDRRKLLRRKRNDEFGFVRVEDTSEQQMEWPLTGLFDSLGFSVVFPSNPFLVRSPLPYSGFAGSGNVIRSMPSAASISTRTSQSVWPWSSWRSGAEEREDSGFWRSRTNGFDVDRSWTSPASTADAFSFTKEWLSGLTSPNERVPEPAPGPAAPARVVERGSLQIFLKRRGRPEPSTPPSVSRSFWPPLGTLLRTASTSWSSPVTPASPDDASHADFASTGALHQVEASRPTEHIMNSLGPPTSNVIMPVLERLLGDHLSNRTVAATACGAYEELWKNLTFLVPVSKRLKDIQVRIPGRRRNLLSWVQILLGPQVILLKLQAVMSLENTFSASLLVKTAYGVVYAGDNQDILFGSVNVTFAGDGWLVPAKSNATSEPVTGELLLQACVQRPLDCGKVVEQLFGNTLATLDVSMTALVEGKFKITVNATERNVPLSLHHKL